MLTCRTEANFGAYTQVQLEMARQTSSASSASPAGRLPVKNSARPYRAVTEFPRTTPLVIAPLYDDPEVVGETGVTAKPAPMMGGPFVATCGEMNLTEAEPSAKDESWNENREKPEA